MNKFLMESTNLKPAAPIGSMLAAIAGARIKLEKADRVAIVLQMGTSTAATAVFTIKQHNAATGGTSKVLATANPYYKKVAAATNFTKVEPATAQSAYDVSADFAANDGVVVIEVLSEQLDVDNGFAWISVDVTAAGVAKNLAAMYLTACSRFSPAYALDI